MNTIKKKFVPDPSVFICVYPWFFFRFCFPAAAIANPAMSRIIRGISGDRFTGKMSAPVAVPIFKNKDYHRGVEFALSKAIVNQIEMRTPYKVVDREKADTVLEGEITDIEVHTISQDTSSAIPQEQLYDIKVNFTWKDQRSGLVLCNRTNFEQTTTFYPTLGEPEFEGSQSGVEKLALGIVQELQADW